MKRSERPASRRSTLIEWVGENLLPNCTEALRLAEQKVHRDLDWGERLALRYHGQLCPFCGCAAEKVARARAHAEACALSRGRFTSPSRSYAKNKEPLRGEAEGLSKNVD